MATSTTMGTSAGNTPRTEDSRQKKVLYWVIGIGAVLLAVIVLALSRMTASPTVDQTIYSTPTTTTQPAADSGYNNGTLSSGQSMQGAQGIDGTGYNNGHPNTDPVQPNNAPIK